jgi:hypothetical protein
MFMAGLPERHCHGMRGQFKPETVIPGRAKREPGIHNHRIYVQRQTPARWLWIPGLRQEAHPGMTI